MLRFCSYGEWRTHEASSIEPNGEWVRKAGFRRRECRNCGRREEISLQEGWDGYHMDSEFESPDDEPSTYGQIAPPDAKDKG